jgi:uncharacterized alkaline shock family protein YloU
MTDVAADIPGQRREGAEPAATDPPATDPPANDPPADPTAGVPGRVAHVTGRVASQVVDRLRNSAEMAGERGTTAIADEVVEKITGIAVRAVPGVYDTGGDVSRAFAAVRQRIGLGNADESADRGISVKLDGTRARVDITLVVEYGFVVNTVTAQVRANVIGAVEKMLGLQVTEVNIVVDDVHVGETTSSPTA